MAVTDDERIIEALAKSRYEGVEDKERSWENTTAQAQDIYRKFAAKHLAALRALGGDVTIPPAPEPTYTIRLTEEERLWLIRHVGWNNWQADRQDIANKLRDAQPDPEPGA